METIRPGQLIEIETEKVNLEIIDLTKHIIEQNKIVLEMNRELLKILSAPMRFVKTAEE